SRALADQVIHHEGPQPQRLIQRFLTGLVQAQHRPGVGDHEVAVGGGTGSDDDAVGPRLASVPTAAYREVFAFLTEGMGEQQRAGGGGEHAALAGRFEEVGVPAEASERSAVIVREGVAAPSRAGVVPDVEVQSAVGQLRDGRLVGHLGEHTAHLPGSAAVIAEDHVRSVGILPAVHAHAYGVITGNYESARVQLYSVPGAGGVPGPVGGLGIGRAFLGIAPGQALVRAPRDPHRAGGAAGADLGFVAL